ncbi:hypothetical protein L1987_54507 [Smallanthus sonchifolius]|uniref:Uncharacterized protein n=1 Tax=Smallanthus sonchifolius TaxID=185202 RepID=A0ACB9E6T4_9ASTR|nr:hypothetical protein L1987_54507 [Smallanthus sonchifolius]
MPYFSPLYTGSQLNLLLDADRWPTGAGDYKAQPWNSSRLITKFNYHPQIALPISDFFTESQSFVRYTPRCTHIRAHIVCIFLLLCLQIILIISFIDR